MTVGLLALPKSCSSTMRWEWGVFSPSFAATVIWLRTFFRRRFWLWFKAAWRSRRSSIAARGFMGWRAARLCMP